MHYLRNIESELKQRLNNPQCQHLDRFHQSLLEYQEISAHIQELTFLVHLIESDPNVTVSCLGPLKCQNFEVLSECDQIPSQSMCIQFISHCFWGLT